MFTRKEKLFLSFPDTKKSSLISKFILIIFFSLNNSSSEFPAFEMGKETLLSIVYAIMNIIEEKLTTNYYSILKISNMLLASLSTSGRKLVVLLHSQRYLRSHFSASDCYI